MNVACLKLNTRPDNRPLDPPSPEYCRHRPWEAFHPPAEFLAPALTSTSCSKNCTSGLTRPWLSSEVQSRPTRLFHNLQESGRQPETWLLAGLTEIRQAGRIVGERQGIFLIPPTLNEPRRKRVAWSHREGLYGRKALICAVFMFSDYTFHETLPIEVRRGIRHIDIILTIHGDNYTILPKLSQKID